MDAQVDLSLRWSLKSYCRLCRALARSLFHHKNKTGSIAQSKVLLTADPGVTRSNIKFMEIDHEIISLVILPLLLIQVGQLSVIGKSMCTKYWLTA